MIETIQDYQILIAAFVVAVAVVVVWRRRGAEIAEQTSEGVETTADKLDELANYLRDKAVEILLVTIGVSGLLIAFEVSTPLPNEMELLIMYCSIILPVALVGGTNLYKKIKSKPNVEYFHQKNPKAGVAATYDLPTDKLDEVMVLEPYFDADYSGDNISESLEFKRRTLSDLEDMYIDTAWGRERAKACYRFYPDELVAITSNRSGMTPYEEEEYEGVKEYLDEYDLQVREDFRRVRNNYEKSVDTETDHRVNEFLHDFQDVAFNETRSFSERIGQSKSAALDEILEESPSERLDLEHPREKHKKSDVLDAFEGSDAAFEDYTDNQKNGGDDS